MDALQAELYTRTLVPLALNALNKLPRCKLLASLLCMQLLGLLRRSRQASLQNFGVAFVHAVAGAAQEWPSSIATSREKAARQAVARSTKRYCPCRCRKGNSPEFIIYTQGVMPPTTSMD